MSENKETQLDLSDDLITQTVRRIPSDEENRPIRRALITLSNIPPYLRRVALVYESLTSASQSLQLPPDAAADLNLWYGLGEEITEKARTILREVLQTPQAPTEQPKEQKKEEKRPEEKKPKVPPATGIQFDTANNQMTATRGGGQITIKFAESKQLTALKFILANRGKTINRKVLEEIIASDIDHKPSHYRKNDNRKIEVVVLDILRNLKARLKDKLGIELYTLAGKKRGSQKPHTSIHISELDIKVNDPNQTPPASTSQ